MMDTRQKLTPPRPGAPTRANDTGHIISALKRMLIQGQGILLKPMGDCIQINATGGPAVSGGGSGNAATQIWKSAPTKAELPSEPNLYWLGRVDGDGPDNGMICVVNATHDGWDAINFFE